MAERRMFHACVVESDAFLDLPTGAQLLYFHLGMHADDDGFVNGPKQIARKLRRPAKDLQMLIDSGYLLNFDGIMVLKHWRMANNWRSDRLQLPRHPELAKQIYTLPSKEYTLQRFPKAKNLLQEKEKLLRRPVSPLVSHGESQKRREENSLEENKIEKKNVEAEEKNPGHPAWPGFTAATTAQSKLNFMNGTLGKGVVLLSEEQMDDLLDKMGLDGFDYYVEKLADFILRKQVKVSNHYGTILKWWEQDKGVK